MTFDNRTGHEQAQSHPVFLGRDEWLEQPARDGGAIPAPLSDTLTPTHPVFSGATLTITARRAEFASAIASKAFMTRFRTHCCNWIRVADDSLRGRRDFDLERDFA